MAISHKVDFVLKHELFAHSTFMVKNAIELVNWFQVQTLSC